jgi:hypothetical protein
MRTDSLTPEEIKSLRQLADYIYYKSPRRFLRKISRREVILAALNDPVRAAKWFYNTALKRDKKFEKEIVKNGQ